jgi:hypothetical protein
MSDTDYYELHDDGTYVLVEKFDPDKELFTTAACIHCKICTKMISGMGGPGRRPVCVECKRKIELTYKLLDDILANSPGPSRE